MKSSPHTQKQIQMCSLCQDPQGVVNGHPLTSKGLLMDTRNPWCVPCVCSFLTFLVPLNNHTEPTGPLTRSSAAPWEPRTSHHLGHRGSPTGVGHTVLRDWLPELGDTNKILEGDSPEKEQYMKYQRHDSVVKRLLIFMMSCRCRRTKCCRKRCPKCSSHWTT